MNECLIGAPHGSQFNVAIGGNVLVDPVLKSTYARAIDFIEHKKGLNVNNAKKTFSLIDYNPGVVIVVAFEYVIGRLVVLSITEVQCN